MERHLRGNDHTGDFPSSALLRQQQQEFRRHLLRQNRSTPQDVVTPEQTSNFRNVGASPWELLNAADTRTQPAGQWNLQTPQGQSVF